MQGIVLSIRLLISAASAAATLATTQKRSSYFDASYKDTGISGMQDCSSSGALSLAIIGTLMSFVGTAIYVS